MTQFHGPANVFFPLDGASEHFTDLVTPFHHETFYFQLHGHAFNSNSQQSTDSSKKLRASAVMKILEDSIKHTVTQSESLT